MSRDLIDPYRAWLGLVTRPRHFYDLLGVAEMVHDDELIRMAAARRLSQLQAVPAEQRTAAWTDLVGKVKAARACLLDPAQKNRYDERLRSKSASPPMTAPAPPPSVAVAEAATSSFTSNASVVDDPMAPVTIPGLSPPEEMRAVVAAAPNSAPVIPTIVIGPAAKSPVDREIGEKLRSASLPTAGDAKPVAISLTPTPGAGATPKPAGRATKSRVARSGRRLSANAVVILGVVSFVLLVGAFVWIVQVWIRPSQRAFQAEMAAQPSSARDLPLPSDARENAPEDEAERNAEEVAAADQAADGNPEREEVKDEEDADAPLERERIPSEAADGSMIADEEASKPVADEDAVKNDENSMPDGVPVPGGMSESAANDDGMPMTPATPADQKTAMSSAPMPMPSDQSMDTMSDTPADNSNGSPTDATMSSSDATASADTDTATQPLTPLRELSDKERRPILAALKLAKRSIKELRMDDAEQQLEKAETLADGSTMAPMVERLSKIQEYNRQFWEAVEQGLEGLAGQEIEVDGELMMVVDVDSDRLTVHRQGRNQRIARRRLPPRLALAIADRRLAPDDLVSHQIRGSFLAIHATNRQLAIDAWKKAESMGADVQQLVQSLDDRYDPPSMKGRSANKKDEMSEADAATP